MNNDPARLIIIVLGDVASLQTHFVRLSLPRCDQYKKPIEYKKLDPKRPEMLQLNLCPVVLHSSLV